VAAPRAFRLSLRRAALAVLLAVTSLGAGADEREAQLERLRGRIDKLQRELNDTRGQRDTARDDLHAQERRIDELLRSLRDTETRLQQQARNQKALQRRAERERAQVQAQRLALETQLRAAHAMGQQPYLKLLLNQEHPAAAARVMTYYRYLNDARLQRITDLQATLARLEQIDTELAASTRALGELRASQEHERQALESTRRRRAELLASLNRQVETQTQEIGRLRSDEQRLERLVKELKAAIVAEPTVPFPGPTEHFATLKGRLPLPASGRIAARYGETKGVGDLRWRGIVVGGKEGQTVQAVSRGRVAYADWLKGFGLLLILDHGDGYMTLYGHNQTLHRRVGDWVEAGHPIAAMGNSGDAPGTGVYFEIRHNGSPHDPLLWCAVGRAKAARTRR
jgi:murein hydrolase activator